MVGVERRSADRWEATVGRRGGRLCGGHRTRRIAGRLRARRPQVVPSIFVEEKRQLCQDDNSKQDRQQDHPSITRLRVMKVTIRQVSTLRIPLRGVR